MDRGREGVGVGEGERWIGEGRGGGGEGERWTRGGRKRGGYYSKMKQTLFQQLIICVSTFTPFLLRNS